MKLNKLYWKAVIAVSMIIIILNSSSISQPFCDWYVAHIFPIGLCTYGRLNGLFSVSVGEWMMVAGIVLLFVALICGVSLIFLRIKKQDTEVFFTCKKRVIIYYKLCLAAGLLVVLLVTVNYSMLFGCSPIMANESLEEKEYSLEELEILRNYLVENVNILAEKIERDETGYAVYSADYSREAQKAMNNLSGKYPRLKGYYPKAKPIHNSRIMSMMGIAGVYFSVSLEANYNNEMYFTMYPSTICHEYAHLKGYVHEDEANFLGYLACIGSEDTLFQYSGYMSALDYVENAYWESVDQERYERQIWLNDLADADFWMWLKPEVEAKVYYADENTVVSADQMTEAREVMHDISLKLAGVEDGIASYDRVTELLLQYYDGILY